jgi:hypothetical protein
MELPFSHDAFLDVFGAYNSALWPAAVLLWLATAGLGIHWGRARHVGGTGPLALLAVHWAWSGVAYHWLFFSRINTAAALFGAAFVAQAVLFAWLALSSRARFHMSRRPRNVVGIVLVCYGLAYPLVSLSGGLTYPRAPLFAVPCPTTMVTAGFLLMSEGLPRFVNIVPILWTVVGGSAAVFLGIQADLPLIAAGVALGLDACAPRTSGRCSPRRNRE